MITICAYRTTDNAHKSNTFIFSNIHFTLSWEVHLYLPYQFHSLVLVFARLAETFLCCCPYKRKEKTRTQFVSSPNIFEDCNTNKVRKFWAESVGPGENDGRTQLNKTMSIWVGLGWFKICLAREFWKQINRNSQNESCMDNWKYGDLLQE